MPFVLWLNHVAAIGSRRLEDNENPPIYGSPDMRDLRQARAAIAQIDAAIKGE
jgi:hypothetical protein